MSEMTIKIKNNITSFIEGNINYYFDRKSTPKHIREQIFYRMLRCAPCTLNKSCLQCGCNIPQLFFAPHKFDSLKNWDPCFHSPEVWEQKKKEMNPSFFSLIRNNTNIIPIYKELWT